VVGFAFKIHLYRVYTGCGIYKERQNFTTMDVIKRCARCGVKYNELHNFGSLQCNMHPSEYGPAGYSCCQKEHRVSWRRRAGSFADFGFSTPHTVRERRIPGCVRCDHGDGSDVQGVSTGTPVDVTLGQLWDTLLQHHAPEFVETHMTRLINAYYGNHTVDSSTVLPRIQPHVRTSSK